MYPKSSGCQIKGEESVLFTSRVPGKSFEELLNKFSTLPHGSQMWTDHFHFMQMAFAKFGSELGKVHAAREGMIISNETVRHNAEKAMID